MLRYSVQNLMNSLTLLQILIEKVKKQLSTQKFGEFRQSVGAFMRGEQDGQHYHAVVVSLGLSHLIPEMASLLTDPLKRAAVLSVHEASASTSKTWALESSASESQALDSLIDLQAGHIPYLAPKSTQHNCRYTCVVPTVQAALTRLSHSRQ